MTLADKCAPKKCLCGAKLSKPFWGPIPGTRYRDNGWQIYCEICHTHYAWGWHPRVNGCWKIRSDLPLFDTKQIVAVGN
jgi:hypothetical protein